MGVVENAVCALWIPLSKSNVEKFACWLIWTLNFVGPVLEARSSKPTLERFATAAFETVIENAKQLKAAVGGPALVVNPLAAVAEPVFPAKKVNVAPLLRLFVMMDVTARFAAALVGTLLSVSKFQNANVPDEVTDPGVLPVAQRQRS